MTTYLVTRHGGAVDWLRNRGIKFEHLSHLDIAAIKAGDRVIGPLPVSKIVELVERGAHYIAIDMTLPEHARGPDLSAQEMEHYGARLVEYQAKLIGEVLS
jgi:CRISPR-associated protein Csx16